MKKTDFCLAMMPYQSVDHPSVAMGLLTAASRQAGFSTLGTYPSLRFAEAIGTDRYAKLADAYLSQLGEWSFAATAFPGFSPDASAYYGLLSDLSSTSGRKPPFPLDELAIIREMAQTFVKAEAIRIVESGVRILGCGAQFQQQCASLALLREAKALDPSIITILGGVCYSGAPGRIARESFPWVDVVFSGEADTALGELLRLLLDHGPSIPREKLPAGAIAASGYLADASGEPVYALAADINALPVPDHSDFFRERAACKAVSAGPVYLAFEGGRGCAWAHKTGGCTFCATARERAVFRPKSPDKLFDELSELQRRHGIKAFEAADEMCSPEFMTTLFPRLAAMEQPPFLLAFDIRAALSEDEVRLLRDAGCVWLQPGIESLSDGALRCMNKGLSAAVAVRLLRLDLENGISTSWNILRGFPGEEASWYEGMAELLPLLFHLEPPNTFGHMRIDRNSIYQRQPEKYGLKIKPARVYQHIFPLDGTAMEGFVHFFEPARETGLSGSHPANQQVAELVKEWKRLFYSDPSQRPRLELLSDAGNALGQGGAVVLDTRPMAHAPQTSLSAEQFAILHACRNPVAINSHAEQFLRRLPGMDAARLEADLGFLLQRGFIAVAGGRYISLVAKPPRFPIPTPEEVLSGAVKLR